MDDTIRFSPIGYVRSPYLSAEGTPIQGSYGDGETGEIIINEEFAPGLADLDGFSHIWILFHLHKSEGYELKVIPFLDDELRGVFSTRAPKRPNQIGLSLVRLLGVEKNVLKITDFDLLDGTPILDIKPYNRDFDCVPDARCGWLEKLPPEERRRRSQADERFAAREKQKGESDEFPPPGDR